MTAALQLSLGDALDHPEPALLPDDIALVAREQRDLHGLAVHRLGEPLPDQEAVLQVRRLHQGHEIGLGVETAVDHHDLDARLGGGIDGRHEAFSVARVDDQQVGALGDHVLDVADLLRHVVLAVGRRHGAARLLGLVLRGLQLRRVIGRVQREHGDADLAVGGGCEAGGAGENGGGRGTAE